MSTKTYTLQANCHYCDGHGYVQLLVGGTETCYSCKGSGKLDDHNDQSNHEYA